LVRFADEYFHWGPNGARRERITAALPAAVALAALFLAWHLVATHGSIGADVLPSPGRVIRSGWRDRQSLIRNLWPTLQEVGLGFAASLVASFVLSIVMDRWTIVRRALLPLMIASQTIPIIVLAPLVVIWFGFGIGPKIFLVALVTFFPLVLGLVEGYESSEKEALTLVATMGAGWWRRFALVRLPSALPSFFTGLRVSITYAVVAAIFAEYAGARRGLGLYMQGAKASFRTDLVLAAVLLTAAVTLLLYLSTHVIQRLTTPWHRPNRGPRP
jgi:ABC-type nitrate/sulfonate/bicarbonate transport system permease component